MGWKWSGWIVAAAVLIATVIFFVDRPHKPANSALADQHAEAPDFSLPDLSGHSLNLASFRGKVVLLDFWATWCEPCREETPRFVELQKKYGDQGLQILGVSMDDSPEPVRDFYSSYKMNYPVVMGNAKLGDLYGGVLGLPVAFLIDRDGRVQSRHIGATAPGVFEREVIDLLARKDAHF